MYKQIAKVSDIPEGEIKTFEIDGKDISIANVNGEFFAIEDTCTHEQCSLGDGELDEERVTCPCHGAQFNVKDGRVLALPAVEDVGTYMIKKEGEDILVEV
jgi:nitrite reductase/ring-hydroxylating ferredoxin subunit